jgi:hypothetical protein
MEINVIFVRKRVLNRKSAPTRYDGAITASIQIKKALPREQRCLLCWYSEDFGIG